MRKLILLSALLISFIAFGFISSGKIKIRKGSLQHKNGDIIFIVNPSGQGKAIQLATKSKYTHVGIIFFEDGKEYVYHAVEPVMRSPLNEFTSMSADGTYEIKRLKDQSLLTPEAIIKMLSDAKSKLGTHYDLGFSWDDKQLYCSEFVWKVYNKTLNLSIGALRPLKEFDLTHPAVKQKMEERYGKNIPMDEKMISPGDMYNSNLLE
ncbi:MAG: YiiX family permuted papain-like enzyme [Bacteroidetes bacterium]|nr:YiiX family permuted papain-like enzyme [Bacteroidota bacterium]